MSSRSRWLVLLISTPLVVVAAIGGLLGASAAAPQGSFPQLRIFQDVVGLIMSSYVEPVDIDKVMDGAMHGLADGLDPSSAYLPPDEVASLKANTPLPPAGVGVVVTRQFYLRILGVRDGSPAARAGLRTGDYIRGIDGKSTREVSMFTGTRLLRGQPGSKVQLTIIRGGNTADPHVVDLVRELPGGPAVASRELPNGDGYLHVVSFDRDTAAAMSQQVATLRQGGASDLVIDLRGTADGTAADGVAAARLFVKAGTLATLAGRSDTDRTVTKADPGDGAITMPVVLLVSTGTARAAEIFAAALSGNARADLVGEPTAGLAGVQHLVDLPDGAGLWLTYEQYLANDGHPIEDHGLTPTVLVASPTVGFGDVPPATDKALDQAVEHLHAKKAA